MCRYTDELLRLNCAPDILAEKLFPNTKEITESFGAYHAVGRTIVGNGVEWRDRDVVLISVGDGHTPRTAALFAFRSAWMCYSIDPYLGQREYNIARLELIRDKIENVKLDLSHYRVVIVVMVHSHATIEATLKSIKTDWLVTIPCCVRHNLDLPYVGYDDKNIKSPKNTVKVWKLVKETP